MILRGILLFEDGGFQQVGELRSVSQILKTIETLIPQLQREEKRILLSQFSKEELAALIENQPEQQKQESTVTQKLPETTYTDKAYADRLYEE